MGWGGRGFVLAIKYQDLRHRQLPLLGEEGEDVFPGRLHIEALVT